MDIRHTIYTKYCSKKESDRHWAVGKMYEVFSRPLMAYLKYKFMALSSAVLEEVLQDAFIRLLTTSSAPNSPDTLQAWIYKVVTNIAIDDIRSSHAHTEISLEELGDAEMGDKQFWASDTDQGRAAERCVGEKLGEFSRRQPERASSIMLQLNGLGIREIAEIYGRTEAAMKQFIYESKKSLKPLLSDCLELIAEER
jgi:RNA polymerase sigma factor (sigma-70 family)